MRNYKIEFENRVAFIKSVLCESGAKGIVYGNSGGKDSALVGILCKAACENTVGIILPCTSKRNYDEDTADAKEVAENIIAVARGNEINGARNNNKERPPTLKKDINVGNLKSVERINHAYRHQYDTPNDAAKIEFCSHFFHGKTPFL